MKKWIQNNLSFKKNLAEMYDSLEELENKLFQIKK